MLGGFEGLWVLTVTVWGKEQSAGIRLLVVCYSWLTMSWLLVLGHRELSAGDLANVARHSSNITLFFPGDVQASQILRFFRMLGVCVSLLRSCESVWIIAVVFWGKVVFAPP